MNAALGIVVRRLAPVLAAMVVFAITVQLLGYSGLEVLGQIGQGSVGSPNAVVQSVRWSLPLILLGLGALISFRSGFFNVGGLGQFYLGAVGATAIATSSTAASWPPVLAIVLSVAAAAVLGAVWSLIPGALRVLVGADEVVTTLMANFVAALLLQYVVAGPLKDTSGSGQGASSPPIPAAFRISDANGLSAVTIGIVVVAAALVCVLVYKTSFGVLSGIAGRNATTLEWQGIPVRRIGLQAFAITGALSGIAGAMEILGPTGRLVAGLSPQVGNTAMLVALVAGLAAYGAVLAALFFGALTAASLFLPVVAQLPSSAIAILNGLIAIFVTASIVMPARQRRSKTPAAEPTPPSTQREVAAR